MLESPLVPVFGGTIPPLILPSYFDLKNNNNNGENKDKPENENDNEKIRNEKLMHKKTIDSNYLFFRMINSHILSCGDLITSLSSVQNTTSFTVDDNEIEKGVINGAHVHKEATSLASGDGSLVRTYYHKKYVMLYLNFNYTLCLYISLSFYLPFSMYLSLTLLSPFLPLSLSLSVTLSFSPYVSIYLSPSISLILHLFYFIFFLF